jgi:hypothetical protein
MHCSYALPVTAVLYRDCPSLPARHAQSLPVFDRSFGSLLVILEGALDRRSEARLVVLERRWRSGGSAAIRSLVSAFMRRMT